MCGGCVARAVMAIACSAADVLWLEVSIMCAPLLDLTVPASREAGEEIKIQSQPPSTSSTTVRHHGASRHGHMSHCDNLGSGFPGFGSRQCLVQALKSAAVMYSSKLTRLS